MRYLSGKSVRVIPRGRRTNCDATELACALLVDVKSGDRRWVIGCADLERPARWVSVFNNDLPSAEQQGINLGILIKIRESLVEDVCL